MGRPAWDVRRGDRRGPAILQETLDDVGAIVMGRRSFDKNEGDGGWDASGPVGDTPCFVVTYYPAISRLLSEPERISKL